MTNKQVMQLMTELGLHDGGMPNWVKNNAWVRFARKLETLVRDDERKKCAADYLQDCCDAVDAARLEEREACALLCDEWFASTAGQAIRARGEK